MKYETEPPPRDIRLRSFDYALRAIKLYQHLQGRRDGAGWVLGKQYLRSATSIGAKLQEARSAESRADFIHKCGVALKEAGESLYWLQLIKASEIVPKGKLLDLVKETDELVSIITSIIKNSKKGKLARAETVIHTTLE